VRGRGAANKTLHTNVIAHSCVTTVYADTAAATMAKRFSNLGVLFTDMDGSPYSSASQMHTLSLLYLKDDTDSIMTSLKCKAWRK